MLEFLHWRELLVSCNFANEGCPPLRVAHVLGDALYNLDMGGLAQLSYLYLSARLGSTCEGWFCLFVVFLDAKSDERSRCSILFFLSSSFLKQLSYSV